jgi:radical SAM superfamily enzyme with C-terminal helix-hairpin-helix motif
MDLQNFMQKTVQRKGILGLGTDDPKVTKVN